MNNGFVVCSSSPVLLYSGGMPRASYGDRHCLTVQQDKTHVTLDFTSRVIDFFTVHSIEQEKGEKRMQSSAVLEWKWLSFSFLLSSSEFDDPSAVVVLLEEELVVIDLQSPGWPTLPTPYLAPLHSSAITCSFHISCVPPKLWERLVNAGKAQQGQQQTHRVRSRCGSLREDVTAFSKEVLIWGHETCFSHTQV